MRPTHLPSKAAETIAPITRFGGFSERTLVIIAFAGIALCTFLLRIFYCGHLYQDDGLWFTAAEELLRGKALYRDIYFDKPPAIVLIYAGLFKLFGAHILTIRLFTIGYSLAESAMLFAFAKWLYGKRTGLIAAALFAVFATTFTTGHVQGLNTDLLMTLPYTASAYFLMRACNAAFGDDSARWRPSQFGLLGGIAAAAALQVNPKGVFAFAFLVPLLLTARYLGAGVSKNERRDEGITLRSRRDETAVSLAALTGALLGAAPFVALLAATRSLNFYWRYVWDWGMQYAGYYPASQMLITGLVQTASYFLLNNTLLAGLVFLTARAARGLRRRKPEDIQAGEISGSGLRADTALLIWFAVSFVAMSSGGRFFGHYFLLILPALCMINARALPAILGALPPAGRLVKADTAGGSPVHGGPSQNLRLALLILLAVGFAVTIVRFHTRTAILAADWVRGVKSASTRAWFHERLNTEERMVAATVRNLSLEPEEAATTLGPETLRESTNKAAPPHTSDYLFVWGYRPEIYFWSGLRPASKYLSSQALTGVPADVHYFDTEYRIVLDDTDTAAARRQLAAELASTRPEYIVDELGFFNADLAISRFSELSEILSAYKYQGSVGRFIIYRRADIIEAHKKMMKGER